MWGPSPPLLPYPAAPRGGRTRRDWRLLPSNERRIWIDENGRRGSSPQPSSLFDLTRPSSKLGGLPRAACLIRAESIEGIFHNEIVWPVEAAAPGFSCHPPQWVEGAYLSVQHTPPAGNSWGGTSPPNFDFPQSWTARDAEPRLTLAPSPRHIIQMGKLRSKKEEIWSYSF